MSFKKAIKHGKERRREYRGSKRLDSSCRNHGGCPYCTTGRLFASKRRGMSLKEVESELLQWQLSKSKPDPELMALGKRVGYRKVIDCFTKEIR